MAASWGLLVKEVHAEANKQAIAKYINQMLRNLHKQRVWCWSLETASKWRKKHNLQKNMNPEVGLIMVCILKAILSRAQTVIWKPYSTVTQSWSCLNLLAGSFTCFKQQKVLQSASGSAWNHVSSEQLRLDSYLSVVQVQIKVISSKFRCL